LKSFKSTRDVDGKVGAYYCVGNLVGSVMGFCKDGYKIVQLFHFIVALDGTKNKRIGALI
jgi:hypothetical protein